MADTNQDAQSDQTTFLLGNDHPFVGVVKEHYLDMEWFDNEASAEVQAQTGSLAA